MGWDIYLLTYDNNAGKEEEWSKANSGRQGIKKMMTSKNSHISPLFGRGITFI